MWNMGFWVCLPLPDWSKSNFAEAQVRDGHWMPESFGCSLTTELLIEMGRMRPPHPPSPKWISTESSSWTEPRSCAWWEQEDLENPAQAQADVGQVRSCAAQPKQGFFYDVPWNNAQRQLYRKLAWKQFRHLSVLVAPDKKFCRSQYGIAQRGCCIISSATNLTQK